MVDFKDQAKIIADPDNIAPTLRNKRKAIVENGNKKGIGLANIYGDFVYIPTPFSAIGG